MVLKKIELEESAERMVKKATSLIEKYNMISEGDIVAAGVSGGADSLCLLFVLLEYQKKVSFDLVVVHVNHLIRKEAGEDAAFVKGICDKQEIPFYLKEIDVKKLAKEKHLSEEEAGRKVRYEAFEEALERYKKDSTQIGKVAVAHHQADSAETMLFHLFRGTGIYGMTGILPVNGNIIRPLITHSRREIEDYLTQKGQMWCIDCTNEEDTYTRNKIRHHILEYANGEINPKATYHVAKAALQMVELREYLELEIKQMAISVACLNDGEIRIDIKKMIAYPSFLQSQFLLHMIEELMPGRKDIGYEHIQSILNLIDKQGTKEIHLPEGFQVVKEYDFLRIKKKQEESKEQKRELFLDAAGEYVLENGSVLEISFLNPSELEGIEENKYTKYFDYDRINNCLCLRRRQQGDYFCFNDKGQKKSLKEYFIHEKIPSTMRDEISLIADGNHILWIIGYRISAYYKVTKETKKIVQMTIRRDEHVRKN